MDRGNSKIKSWDVEKITYAAIATLGTAIAFTSSKENAAKYAACVLMSRFIDFDLLEKLGLDTGTYFSKRLVRLLSNLRFFAADAFVGSSISKLLSASTNLSPLACNVLGSGVGIALFSNTLYEIKFTERNNRKWIEDFRNTGYEVAAHIVYALSFSYFRSDSLLSNFLAFASSIVLYGMMKKSPLCVEGVPLRDNKVRLDEMAKKFKPSEWLASSVISATALTVASYLTSKSPKLEAAGILVPAACLTVIHLLCEKPQEFINNKLAERGL